MRPEHRRFLVVDEVIGSSIVNFAINGALAWLTYRSLPSVPLFGRTSMAADTAVTALVLPLLTALIGTPLVRLGVARGKLPRPDAPPPSRAPSRSLSRSLSRWRPRSSVARGLVLGVASLLWVAAPCILVFALVGPASLPTARFIWVKASFAAALGALVTPLIGWWALHDS